ncbi:MULTISPECIES: RNA pyrophosphohydrolase [unclassified Iodidimonas]|jgi:putative (di)nucleoside polyphosphate hydrolase|uniref:RNA pyrophosphohydrolase n=1 Tax=unclassified Iodidimonas TaxID=2626145 RepID=UPI002482DC43|nr:MULTISPECIES: RNA pyrophosphohydrolase [unclassified Iodidimonas]
MNDRQFEPIMAKSIRASDLPYRPCVGMMLLNLQGLVWTGKRIDTTALAWQMPQGGIDPGESPEQAALRELKEETGIEDVQILDQLAQPLFYDLPDELLGKAWKGRYRGQRVHWFAMRFKGDDQAIDLGGPHQEFSAWRWQEAAALPDHIVAFKRPMYEQVIAGFAHLLGPSR